MPRKKLIELLEANQVRFTVITHSPAYTAQEIAQSAHIPGRLLAKTVIVKIDGRLAMAVTRAENPVNTEALRAATGAAQVVLATEDEFVNRFPDCEVGAMPPFGPLYDMEVFVSSRLARDELICFNAGSHRELIQLSYEDFARLAKPVPADF